MNKRESRLRRAKRSRLNMREQGTLRLCIHRTPQHIYAQIISGNGASDTVIASASSLDKLIKGKVKSTGNVETAAKVGKLVAQRALEAGVNKVAFDRSGFQYHGRIKALADAAREGGLQF